MKDYPLVARNSRKEYQGNLKTLTFDIGGVKIGTEKILIIAGPCTVHEREQALENALGIKEAGASLLRGGAYKPRTSPYSFQGLGKPALQILAEAREITELPFVTEVMDQKKVEEVGDYADMFQVGARNMQNFDLLRDVGKYAAKRDKGVLLKTGFLPKLDEVLGAAEYLALEYDRAGKIPKITICERGINQATETMRNTPRPEFLAELRQATYLPVIGDPSHSCGNRELVWNTALDYLNAGANGLLIDVIRDHEKPIIDSVDYCDYKQGLHMSVFAQKLKTIEEHRVPQE